MVDMTLNVGLDLRNSPRSSFAQDRLEFLMHFLDKHGRLAEAHLADFIVDDIFNTLLVPADMAGDDFNNCSHVDGINWFPAAAYSTSSDSSIGRCNNCTRSKNLADFIHLANKCRLDVLLESGTSNYNGVELHDLLRTNLRGPKETINAGSSRLQFDAYASQKKQHEVEIMADLVAAICEKHKINQVVDIGSGKGYLSSFLALQHNLNVLGIDSSNSNVVNASKRNARLQKSWRGLVERATTRARTGQPGRRRTKRRTSSPAVNDSSAGSFVGIVKWMDETTNLGALLAENGTHTPIASSGPFALTGLHTCGNLAARVLEAYVGEQRCLSVVSVGCCYHLIDEEFRDSPYTNTSDSTPKNGFPMSAFLREKRFGLGRNARMLACEALHRIVSQQSTPSATLFHRALLKVILRDKYGTRFDNVRVGRLDKHKSMDFTEYVRQAMLKIKPPEQLTDNEILSYLNNYSHYESQLKHFCRLRSLLAPAIESVILLDRLCYLQEQDGVSSSHLIRLFDPVISPRCHAIVSFKSLPRFNQIN